MELLEFIKLLLFGMVEGVTEWLPVGNRAHMELAEHLLAPGYVEEYMKLFSASIRLGACLAAILVFWVNLWPLSENPEHHHFKVPVLALKVKTAIICLPTVVVWLVFGSFLNNWIFTVSRTAYTMAAPMIFYGIMFLLAERYWGAEEERIAQVSRLPFRMTVYMSIFVLLGILPGVGLPAAAILGALMLGLDRHAATELGFYVSIPLIFWSSLYSLLKSVSQVGTLDGNGTVKIIAAGIAAFLAAFFVIRNLLSYVKNHSFRWLAVYRIIAGLFMLVYFELFQARI